MELKQITKRIGRSIRPLGIARLEGYRFGYWGHSVLWELTGTADITKSDSSEDYVLGVAYELNKSDFNKLDVWEGVSDGRYMRKLLNITHDDKIISGYTYVLRRDGSWRYPEDENAPSPRYVKQCVAAATQMGLPAEYIERCLFHNNNQRLKH